MSLGVSGIDANGRVSASGAVTITGGVLVPNESAGIGDLVYKNGSTIKVVHRGTATGSSITVGGTSYTLYGAIFGFVAGMAMIVAPNNAETTKAWKSSGTSTTGPAYGGGTCLMRNGNKATYVQMNTGQQMSNDSYRGTAGDAVHPTAAYNGDVMTESTFNSNTNYVKQIYGTWKEYLRQTLRVNGAPGCCFGAVADGVKVHEFGRWMSRQIGEPDYPAAYYCISYNEGSGTWWLPSMFELGELMIDEHLDKVNENSAVLSVSKAVYRWSCVRFSSGYAWTYNAGGMSDNIGSTNTVTVRPVTLLKLV